MAFKFRPVDGSFFESLTDLAHKLEVGADLLAQVLADDADREAIATSLAEAETEADQITHSIIKQVNQTFITPIDREDIYSLATGLDDVMDRMDEAADLILLYEVEGLPKEFAKQVAVLQRCAELTAAAMPRLGTRKDLADYWTEINRLESAGDKQYRRILAKLFDGRYEALEVIKLKDIISAMEAAIDGFEVVAHTVEQIVVKES
jgi:predicted phosphate transport protein (TIGR00153 family)